MSKETIEWLNANTMIGKVGDKEKYAKNNWMILQSDGTYKAWWQTDGYDMAYQGFIPVEDIESRLFNWEPVELMPMFKMPTTADEADGIDAQGHAFKWIGDTGKKAIVHPVTGQVFSYVGVDSYNVHGYVPWLIENPGKIVDAGELGITSAGLLRGGGVAYVTMSLPETVEVAGLEFNPTLMAVTSIDTTRATHYVTSNLVAICDNSMQVAFDGAVTKVRIKHSANSLKKLGNLRDALGVIYKDAEDFQEWVNRLVDIDVTDKQFAQIIEGIIPTPAPEMGNKDGKTVVKNQRSITIATDKKETLTQMWNSDPRCKQWNGTMFGAFQTYNTWSEHVKPRNENAVDRVMTGTIGGQFAKDAEDFWAIVGGIMPEVVG